MTNNDNSIDAIKTVIRSNLSEVLDLPEDSLLDDDSFYDMGVDSLSAVEVSKLINEHFNQDIAPHSDEFFNSPSIQELAELLHKRLSS